MQKLKQVLRWMNDYAATFAAIAVGAVFLHHHATRPHLTTKNDLLFLEGKITDYSFTKGGPGKNSNSYRYYIRLDNYPCMFQIPADFVFFFNKSKFEIMQKRGDNIQLTIPKEFKSDLSILDKHIFIYSLSTNHSTYLSFKDTIRKENDNFDIYAGIIFIMSGIVYYILKKMAVIK